MITIGISRGHFTAPWDFFFCLYNAKTFLDNVNMPSRLLTSEGPIIEENRNDIIEKTSEGSYLIMIDDDMTFEKDSIYKLYILSKSMNADVICGLFSDEYGQPRIQKNGVFLKKSPEDIIEIDGCGMAFTMLSPKIVEAFKREKPFDRVNGLGEDLSFCRKIKEEGFSLYCEPSIKVGHLRLKSIHPI